MPSDARAPKLDSIDLKILAALQRDGRMTKTALADAVGLSPSPAHERVKRLEAAGFIAGYRALIDIDRLVATQLVFVEITLGRHGAIDFARFEAAMRAEDAVIHCHAIGGGVDYIALIAAPGIAAYQALIDGWLGADLGIEKYFTYIVTKPVKRADGWPLESLLAASTRRM